MPRKNVTIKPVKGFPGYFIGSDGSMWSAWRTRRRAAGGRGVESYVSQSMKAMKLKRHNAGYLFIGLRKDGKYHWFLMHRLVLETFVGPCPEGMEALHGDGDKKNNLVSNLRWGTREENIQDSIRHGTFYNATKAAAEVNTGKKRPPFSEECKRNMSIAASERWRKYRLEKRA